MSTESAAVQGGTLRVSEMILSVENDQLRMMWTADCRDEGYAITFFNVSRFSMDSVSAPFMVQGFEILDHARAGWDEDSRYEIRDFEEGCVGFFCESYEIHKIE